MTVTASTPVVPRMWRGHDDPGMPIGAWIGHTVAVGDASGGLNQCEFLFKPEDQAVSGLWYNLEQIDGFLSAVTQLSGFIILNNFEQLGPFIVANRQWRIEFHTNNNTAAAIHYTEGIPPMPLFLGQTARLASFDSVMRVGTLNTNTVVLSVTVQGYIWGPRSVQAEGGLRRPIDSVYGR